MTDSSAILATIPAVPERFYGTVTYVFECGRLVVARVEETIKPKPPTAAEVVERMRGNSRGRI